MDATTTAAIEKLLKRIEGIEGFIYKGNGQDSATVRFSQIEGFIEVAEKFIMAHETVHEKLNDKLSGIMDTINTAKTWIAAAIFFGSVIGSVAGFLLHLYFTGKP